jgi:hypothetical protein
MRLSQPTLDALTSALTEQRGAGSEPLPSLQEAIVSAANEARDRGITPELLLIQLKLLAGEAGLLPMMGDGGSTALREWIVSACVAAYFAAR